MNVRELFFAWMNPGYASLASRKRLAALFGAVCAVLTGIVFLIGWASAQSFGIGMLLAWAILFVPLWLRKDLG